MQTEPTDVLGTLANMIAATGDSPAALSLTDRLTEDLELDWLAKGSLLTQVGDEWGIKITCVQIGELRTVEDVVALIAERHASEDPTT